VQALQRVTDQHAASCRRVPIPTSALQLEAAGFNTALTKDAQQRCARHRRHANSQVCKCNV